MTNIKELFSESESDSDTESDYGARDKTAIKKFRTFMEEFQNDKGDSTTTIVDRTSGCYGIEPDTEASKKFFKYLNKLDKVPDMMYEKQHPERGLRGLMIDLDMYFKKNTVVVKPKHRKDFCEMVKDLIF